MVSLVWCGVVCVKTMVYLVWCGVVCLDYGICCGVMFGVVR